MKGTRHSEEQIIAILKQGEAGLATGEYLLEISATGSGGDAKELLGFRITG